jgi:hypothetical protein
MIEIEDAIARPDRPSNGVAREHKRANWPAVGDVEQCGIPALVRLQIHRRETHGISATVTVNGEIAEPAPGAVV